MCGITGIFAFNLVGKFNLINVTAATQILEKRGPDHQGIYTDHFVGLGHRRLSIIDTSMAANQPMWDEQNRYAIILNGEIFNYKEIKKELLAKGITFCTDSDTEVLLKLYIHEKEKCFDKLNGFYAFCIYDKIEQSFFIARDRYGIKPLLYVYDEDKFIFSSEMKSILRYGIEKQLDFSSLYTYLQLNYIPAPHTIFTQVKKLMPGCFLRIKNKRLTTQSYYAIPYTKNPANSTLTYEDSKEKLKDLLDKSVQRRLIADVSLGSFLSGGIDSSIVTGLAARHKSNLRTFSIGFKDDKYFDETNFANLVAKHFNTEHTVYSLTQQDLYEHVHEVLNYIDEPFADSSAIGVYVLSHKIKKHVRVALSGDGADELLAGYNKHAAFLRSFHPGIKEKIVGLCLPLWKYIPSSRTNSVMNLARQLQRFSEGMSLSPADRYWHWARFTNENEVEKLLDNKIDRTLIVEQYFLRKNELLKSLPENADINDVLLTDMKLVLNNDMLVKVDLMSMANSLEVRVPFLDIEVVNFIFSLPEAYKINSSIRKRILQDAFRDLLPNQLYNRPKKGFEVPLLKWFRHEMKSLIMDDLLSKELVHQQGIFNYTEIEKLKNQLFSANPADIHARIWGLIVFQNWWKKYMR